MNSKEIKTAAVNDLQLIVDMAIEQAEKNAGFSLESYLDVKQHKADTKEYFVRSFNDLFNKTAWKLNYENFSCEFITMSAFGVKNRFNSITECPKIPPFKASKAEKAFNASLQEFIAECRAIYQLTYYGVPDTGIEAKDDLINQHKKAGVNDPIKLCWKYITNPQEIEGVNMPYNEQPKAIFTPYKEFVTA